jgi:predicted Zn-dependent protease
MRFQQVNGTYSGRAYAVLDNVLSNTNAPLNAVIGVAQLYATWNNGPKLEPVLERLVRMAPDEPEFWYHLAGTKALLKKDAEAIQALRRSLELNAKRHPGGTNLDLRAQAEKDPRFNTIRATPEFKELMSH